MLQRTAGKEGLRNSYVLDRKVQCCKDDMFSDLEILESFQQDFDGCNVHDFDIVTCEAKKSTTQCFTLPGGYTLETISEEECQHSLHIFSRLKIYCHGTYRTYTINSNRANTII